ncbi:MAG TPA: hypothetical protein VG890_16615, partial [Puia sp.]|nr:hypothetical protein [Puia sp.]
MQKELEFYIDEITNSIQEIATGNTFETEMVLVKPEEIKSLNKKEGWLFNWNKEFKEPGRLLYKL